jgi:hypothetical protein
VKVAPGRTRARKGGAEVQKQVEGRRVVYC